MIELAITVRNGDRSLTHKHLVYEAVSMSKEDPTLSKLVEEAKESFGDNIEDILLKTKFVW